MKLLSRILLLATPWTAAYQAPPSMDFPGKSTGVGCHCLRAQYIFVEGMYQWGIGDWGVGIDIIDPLMVQNV